MKHIYRLFLVSLIMALMALAAAVLAQVSTPIGMGETVSGTLSESATRAVYTFQAAGGTTVTITLMSDDFDAYLVLQDAAGSTLAEDDDSAGQLNSLISFLLPEDGEYTIIATSLREWLSDGSFFAAGDFILTLESGGGSTAITPTPLPTTVAQSINIGDTVQGALTQAAPSAEYTFTGSAGVVVTITLTSDDFDSYLLLLDTNGNELRTDDDSAGDLDSRIGPFSIPADGAYTIVVDSFGHVVGGDVSVGSYTLMLEQGGGGVIVTPSEGREIALGDTVDGALSSAVLSEEYTFTASQGDIVTITQTAADFDSYLHLMDANRIELMSDDDSAGNLNSRIGPYTIPADGTYIIVADSYGNATGGEGAVGGYQLTLAAAVIHPLEYTQEVSGTISAEEPVVVYSFTAEARDVVTLVLDTTNTNVYIRVDEVGGDYTQQTYGNSRILGPLTLPSAGDYNVTVSSYDTYTPGDYTLVVERITPVEISLGETITTDFTEKDVLYYSFEGQAGDAINVLVNSGQSVDTQVTITAPSGYELITDDDSGEGFDPEIRGLLLSEDGAYSVLIRPFILGDNGEFTLLVEGNALPSIDTASQVVRISEKQAEGVVVFEGVAGETMLLSARVLAGAENEPRITVTQGDTTLAQNTVGMVKRLVIEFVVPEDDPVRVSITNDYFGSAVIEFSIERSSASQ